MKRMTVSLSCVGMIASALFGAVGCDAQVDGDYNGEALAIVNGTVINERTLATPEAHAGLVWLGSGEGEAAEQYEGDYAIGESVQVSGNFPAQFQLEVFQPPPDGTMATVPALNARIALAYIWATDQPIEELIDNSLENPGDDSMLEAILGMAEYHLFIYSDSATESIVLDDIGQITIGAMQAGYNLMRVNIDEPSAEELKECIDSFGDDGENHESFCRRFGRDAEWTAEPNGVATDIPVRLADNWYELLWPLEG